MLLLSRKIDLFLDIFFCFFVYQIIVKLTQFSLQLLMVTKKSYISRVYSHFCLKSVHNCDDHVISEEKLLFPILRYLTSMFAFRFLSQRFAREGVF